LPAAGGGSPSQSTKSTFPEGSLQTLQICPLSMSVAATHEMVVDGLGDGAQSFDSTVPSVATQILQTAPVESVVAVQLAPVPAEPPVEPPAPPEPPLWQSLAAIDPSGL